MKRNCVLFSLSATLVVSLFCFGLAHAIQVDWKKLEAMKKPGIVQMSKTTSPCGYRNGVACRKQSPLESGEKWYAQAAAQGNSEAQSNLKSLGK